MYHLNMMVNLILLKQEKLINKAIILKAEIIQLKGLVVNHLKEETVEEMTLEEMTLETEVEIGLIVEMTRDNLIGKIEEILILKLLLKSTLLELYETSVKRRLRTISQPLEKSKTSQ